MEENNPQLQVGDVIHGWDLLATQRGIHTITSVTKTLAKTDGTYAFYRNISTEVTKPNDNYLGEVKMKTLVGGSRRYFKVKFNPDTETTSD